jgi:glycosyltransferase involved in cell wall biosynthesis
MENLQSTVCVVMPVYNGAKTIMLAIKSLLYQTYPNWNCVIVNDGSNDNTKELLETITDKRFRIIHLSKNRGRGFARQVALENAEGDYLTYLDADDFYHPEKIEQQVVILDKFNDVYLASCGQGSFDNKNILRTIRGIKYAGLHNFRCGDEVKFVPVTSMIRLNAALNIRYNDKLNASEDVDYFSAYLDNRTYYILEKTMYYYYEYESLSYSKTVDYAFNSLKRIYYSRSKIKLNLFLKQFLNTFFKLIVYAVLYPFLGKNFFIKRRGKMALKSDISTFNYCLNCLDNMKTRG